MPNNKKKTYLVTGGLGFIGSSLANELDGNIIVVSKTDTKKDRLKRSDTKLIIRDVRDLTIDDIKNVDVIYHCAGTVHNYHVLNDPHTDASVNIDATVHLLELCKKLSAKPLIIYLSTFFVYGNEYERMRVPITEDSRTDPLAMYPATKLCAESIIKLYQRLYGMPYIIARLTNIYGESEEWDPNIKKAGLNRLIMQAIRGEPLFIYQGGNFYRDYLHVSDAVSALRFLEEHGKNDLYLVGTGSPVKFKDMIDYIWEKTGRKSFISAVEPPAFHQVVGVKNFIADTKKINSLGWTFSIPWKEGLLRVITAYQSLNQP